MIVYGNNISITIAGVDYSTQIESVVESGGEKNYKYVNAYNGNYKKILVGYNPYSLEIKFRLDDNSLHTLYQNTTPVTIIIVATHEDGTVVTTTYSNMVPVSIEYEHSPEDISMATLKYTVEALASNKTDNRVVS